MQLARDTDPKMSLWKYVLDSACIILNLCGLEKIYIKLFSTKYWTGMLDDYSELKKIEQVKKKKTIGNNIHERC